MKYLNITKKEYVKILKNRGKSIKRSTSSHEILKLINTLDKKDVKYLSKFRNIQINDDDSIETLINKIAKDTHKKKFVTLQQKLHKKNTIQEIPIYVNELNRQRIINKINRKKLQQEIYRNLQKRKQDKINNELKKLVFNELANKINITQTDLEKIKQLKVLPLKTLQKIAHQRSINITDVKKDNLIFMLIRSEKSHKEDNYLKFITKDTTNEIHNKINDIRKVLVNVSQYLKKQKLKQIRERLKEIEKKTRIKRSEKTNLLNELTKISTDLKFERKNMISDYNDDNYANLQDIDYMFDDLDDY